MRDATLGAHLSAKKKARELEPIKYETRAVGFGVETSATGTAEQLIAAGIITPDHLPQGRARHSRGHPKGGPVDHWTIRKGSGGMLHVVASHRTEQEDGAADRVRDARRTLDWIEKNDTADLHRSRLAALTRVGGIAVSELRNGTHDRGLRLDAASTAMLGSICDQIDALFGQARAVIDAGYVETIQPERDEYLRKLRSLCELPMPALPAVETETETEASHV